MDSRTLKVMAQHSVARAEGEWGETDARVASSRLTGREQRGEQGGSGRSARVQRRERIVSS